MRYCAVFIIFLVTLAQQANELLCTMLRLNILNDLVDLFDEVLEYGLQCVHATVLAQVSEVRDVVSNRNCLVVGHANVD